MSIFQQSAQALGSTASLTVVTDTNDTATAVFSDIWQMITEFDARFSRFRHDSELTALNESAGTWFTASDECRALLQASLAMSQVTEGLYNPFMLPALQRAGYMESWTPRTVTRNPPDYRDRLVVPADSLEIKHDKIRIPPQSALDLGGIGKGYLLKLLGELLEHRNIANYWLSLGGDILVSGTPPSEPAWSITIADSLRPEITAAAVQATDKLAIATSGITKRRGADWHHIIDPVTGMPAVTDVLTATVCHADPVAADVYASCIVALGSERSGAFQRDHDVTDSLLQITHDQDKRCIITGTRIHL